MHPWTSGAVQGSPLMKTVTQNIWTSDQWKALHWRRLLHRTYEQVISGRFSIEDCYTEHMNKWPVEGSPLTKTVTQNIWTSDQWKVLHWWRLLHRTYEQVISGRLSIEDCYTERMNKWSVEGSPLKTVTQNVWTSDQWKALHWWRLSHRTYEQVISGRFSIDEDCYTEHMNKWSVEGSPLTKTVTQNIWTSDQWKALHWWRLSHRTYEQVISGRLSIDEDCYTEHMNKWPVEGSPLTKTVTQNVWTSDQWKVLHWRRLLHRTYEQVTSGRLSIDEDCHTERMNKWSVHPNYDPIIIC